MASRSASPRLTRNWLSPGRATGAERPTFTAGGYPVGVTAGNRTGGPAAGAAKASRQGGGTRRPWFEHQHPKSFQKHRMYRGHPLARRPPPKRAWHPFTCAQFGKVILGHPPEARPLPRPARMPASARCVAGIGHSRCRNGPGGMCPSVLGVHLAERLAARADGASHQCPPLPNSHSLPPEHSLQGLWRAPAGCPLLQHGPRRPAALLAHNPRARVQSGLGVSPRCPHCRVAPRYTASGVFAEGVSATLTPPEATNPRSCRDSRHVSRLLRCLTGPSEGRKGDRKGTDGFFSRQKPAYFESMGSGF